MSGSPHASSPHMPESAPSDRAHAGRAVTASERAARLLDAAIEALHADQLDIGIDLATRALALTETNDCLRDADAVHLIVALHRCSARLPRAEPLPAPRPTVTRRGTEGDVAI